jgi:hypothetical protein
MALIAEPDRGSGLGEWCPPSQQVAGSGQSDVHKELVRRSPESARECTKQVELGKASDACQVLQVDVLGKTIFQVCSSSSDAIRFPPYAARRSRVLEPALQDQLYTGAESRLAF